MLNIRAEKTTRGNANGTWSERETETVLIAEKNVAMIVEKIEETTVHVKGVNAHEGKS